MNWHKETQKGQTGPMDPNKKRCRARPQARRVEGAKIQFHCRCRECCVQPRFVLESACSEKKRACPETYLATIAIL